MTAQVRNIEALRQLGGTLCLDFVNTIENRASAAPEEFLNTYADLIDWAAKVGLFSELACDYLRGLAVGRPQIADPALNQARQLRESLHRIFLAIAARDEPDFDDLDYLQQTYGTAMSAATLVRQGASFSWKWMGDELHPDLATWIVACSAIDFLASGDLERVKVCANPDGCGWLFFDQSKNGSRRWCSMEGCGSQIKMRRLYAKRRVVS